MSSQNGAERERIRTRTRMRTRTGIEFKRPKQLQKNIHYFEKVIKNSRTRTRTGKKNYKEKIKDNISNEC